MSIPLDNGPLRTGNRLYLEAKYNGATALSALCCWVVKATVSCYPSRTICPLLWPHYKHKASQVTSHHISILYSNWSDGLLFCTAFNPSCRSYIFPFFPSLPCNRLSPFLFRFPTATSISCYQPSVFLVFNVFVSVTMLCSGTVTHKFVISINNAKILPIKALILRYIVTKWETSSNSNNTD